MATSVGWIHTLITLELYVIAGFFFLFDTTLLHSIIPHHENFDYSELEKHIYL